MQYQETVISTDWEILILNTSGGCPPAGIRLTCWSLHNPLCRVWNLMEAPRCDLTRWSRKKNGGWGIGSAITKLGTWSLWKIVAEQESHNPRQWKSLKCLISWKIVKCKHIRGLQIFCNRTKWGALLPWAAGQKPGTLVANVWASPPPKSINRLKRC